MIFSNLSSKNFPNTISRACPLEVLSLRKFLDRKLSTGKQKHWETCLHIWAWFLPCATGCMLTPRKTWVLFEAWPGVFLLSQADSSTHANERPAERGWKGATAQGVQSRGRGRRAQEAPSSVEADRRPRAEGPGFRDGLHAVTLGRENGSRNIKEERDCHWHGLQRMQSPV